MIKRDILEKLEKEYTKTHITSLIGARQVGKSTIMKQLYKKVENDAIYLTFDKMDVLNLFERDIESFIVQYIKPYKYIFIDEIQYSQKSGKYLKYILDEYGKKLFITGSSTPELSIKTLSYLVGRIRIFEIYGINFEEFIAYKDSTKLPILQQKSPQKAFEQFRNLLEEYLLFGTYPAVIVEEDYEEKKAILKDITNTYLLKEIREILQFENSYEFELLLKRLSLADGQLLNYSNLSRDIEIKLKKIKEMINVLEKTYIISTINPFLDNKIKELIKTPKTYFIDTGFKNSLTNNFSETEFRTDKGEIYENFILKAFLQKGLQVNFWNYKNEHEVDFTLEKDGKLYGFEVKSKKNTAKITTSIKKFIDTNSPEILYILNQSQDETLYYKNTLIQFTNHINIFSIVNSI